MNLPYLILPLCIGYSEGFPDKIVDCRITPSLVNAYHEGYLSSEDGENKLITTFVYHGTQIFQLAISVDNFEDALRKYWDQLGKKQKEPTIKQRLGIVN